MSLQPLVSILMTAYNREKYIAEAIKSVLASTYKNFELIIVDDCSKDRTVEIARYYEQTDKRVKVYINDTNLKDYPNRNRAASLAKGEFMMFVDSDDKVFEDGIGMCLNAMLEHKEAGFGMNFKAKGNLIPFYLDANTSINMHFFSESFLIIGPGGTILKRSFFNTIGGYAEKYGPANDMYFNLKAASAGGVVLLPFEFFFYRIHEGQEQNNKFEYLYSNYNYLNDALNDLNLGLSPEQINFLKKKNRRRFSVNIIKYFVKTGNIVSAKKAWQMANFSLAKFLNGIFHF